MILTKELFRTSFYYPAAGCDLNPLLRFSDLTDTFVYTNLGLNEDEVMRYIKNELYRYKGMLEIEDGGRSFIKSDLEYEENTDDIYNVFDGAKDQEEFEEVFNNKMKDPFWGKEIIFNRIIGGKKRKLRLIYFMDEGMKAYVGLSQRGNYIPRYLCTIQSGELEKPNGVMERLMENYEKFPDVWIRGFQYKKSFFGNSSFKYLLYNSNALKSIGKYDQKVQTFGKWYCNPTYQSKDVENFKRHVAAFCRGNNIPKVNDELVLNQGESKAIIRRKPLDVREIINYDAVFTSKNLMEKLNTKNRNIVLWNEIYSDHDYKYPDISVILKFIVDKCVERKYKNIVMTLTGYEDSGEQIAEWANNISSIETVEIRIVSTFDLYSLMKINES